MEHHSNIVPWQLRLRGDRRAAAGGADRRSRRADPRGVRAAADAADAASSRSRTCRTRSARSTRSREIVRLAHAHGRAGADRRIAGRVPHARGRAGARLRLLRRDGHKLYGPTGIGVLYGKASAPRGDAAVHGRRRHDQLGDVRAEHLERAALQVRGGHAAHRRRDRPARGARLHRRRSASTRSPRTSATAGVRHGRCCRRSTACGSIGTAREKASILSFVMDGVHPHDIGTIVDREGVAIRTGHHCAQPVMERFGDSGDRPRVAGDVQHARGDRRAGARAATGARGVRLMSDLSDLYQEVILDHNRRPRNFHALADASHTRRGLQPAVRRPPDAVPEGRRRHRSATWRSKAPDAPSRRRRRR